MKKAKIAALVSCAVFMALVFSCASSGSAAGPGSSAWDWGVATDSGNGGKSTITMTDETLEGLPGHSFTGVITHDYEYGFVNVQLRPADDATAEALKQVKAVSFRVQGTGEKMAVKIVTPDVKDYAYFEYQFDTVEGQPQTVIIPVEYFMQPPWGKTIAPMVDVSIADFIEYQFQGSTGPFAFKLWDFRLHTAGVPTEKQVTPKGAAKPKPAAAAAAEKTIGGDLGAIELIVADNFEYGDGYQGNFADKRLFNGHKIVPGENYTLKITYTASRDLEDIVEVGLVDTTAAASYWKGLSWDDAKDVKMVQLPKSKAGETVSATIKLTTLAGATGTSPQANTLTFQTKGEGKKGAKGSGVKKAFKLNFTEFVFTKD